MKQAPAQTLFCLVTQSFFLPHGGGRLRDEPKERMRMRLVINRSVQKSDIADLNVQIAFLVVLFTTAFFA